MGADRKLKRKGNKLALNEGVKAGIIEAAAISCELIYNNYGKLKSKEERLTVFMTLFIEALLDFENPTDLRKAVRRQLKEMVK